jgi:hypothetical protein
MILVIILLLNSLREVVLCKTVCRIQYTPSPGLRKSALTLYFQVDLSPCGGTGNNEHVWMQLPNHSIIMN